MEQNNDSNFETRCDIGATFWLGAMCSVSLNGGGGALYFLPLIFSVVFIVDKKYIGTYFIKEIEIPKDLLN